MSELTATITIEEEVIVATVFEGGYHEDPLVRQELDEIKSDIKNVNLIAWQGI